MLLTTLSFSKQAILFRFYHPVYLKHATFQLVLTNNKGQDENEREFSENDLVAIYGKEGMTYWNGEFNDEGEGIFVAFSEMDKCLPQPISEHTNNLQSFEKQIEVRPSSLNQH
jgi:hypothetical protein